MLHAEFQLPAEWIPLPEATDFENRGDMFAGLDQPSMRALELNVERVGEFVAGLPAHRDAWVLLRRRGIGAVLTLHGHPAPEGGTSDLIEALRVAAIDPAIDVLNRTVRLVSIPAGDAIETHDFSIAHDFDSGTRPATERATVTIFPPTGHWVVDLMLVTQDLLLFEDSLDYLHSIAETVHPFGEVIE